MSSSLLTNLNGNGTASNGASASASPSPTTTKSFTFSNDTELNGLLTRRQPIVIPSAPKCPKCNKSVFKAEEVRAANKIFHKLCFKCNSCNKLLESNTLTEHQGELHCRSCYAKHFGPKGYGYGCGAGTLSMENGSSLNGHANGGTNGTSNGNHSNNSSNHASRDDLASLHTESNLSPSLSFTSTSSTTSSSFLPQRTMERKVSTTFIQTSGDKCGRCSKAVYMAEKIVAAGHSFHKLCFTCLNCKKLLSSMSCCDNSDGEIFCKPCYGKLYGPKGVGYGISAGALRTN